MSFCLPYFSLKQTIKINDIQNSLQKGNPRTLWGTAYSRVPFKTRATRTVCGCVRNLFPYRFLQESVIPILTDLFKIEVTVMSKATAKKVAAQKKEVDLNAKIDTHLTNSLANIAGELEKLSKKESEIEEVKNIADQFREVLHLQEEWKASGDIGPDEFFDPRLNQPCAAPPPVRRGRQDAEEEQEDARQIWQITAEGELQGVPGYLIGENEGDNGITYNVLELEDGEVVEVPTMSCQRIDHVI